MNRKLRSIIRHEYLTIVKQPAFLLTMLGMPLLIVAIGSIAYFSERTAESNLDELADDISNVVVVDESGLIETDVVEAVELELRQTDPQAAITQVKNEEIDGAIVYPEDVLETQTFDIYMGGGDNFQVSSILNNIGEELFDASIAAQLDSPGIATILQQGANSQVTAYEDGEETAGIAGQIVPGAFLVLFFVILFFTMGYMLLGVSEEKENRSMEMVLSYVHPRTLMSGKLLSIGLVGLTQMLFFTVLGILTYFGALRFEDRLGLIIDFDFSSLVFEPITIAVGFLVLVFGFLMFAALMSGVAAMMPGVKEANSFSGVFFLVPLVPIYASQVIMTAPESALVQFMTYFPLTAPTVMLARNTLGNLEVYEAVIGVVALAAFTALAFLLAAKLFRLGALEYADRVKISSLLK